MNIFDHALNWLVSNGAILGTVLGVLFTVAKAVSNEHAPKAIAVVQGVVDFVAKIVVSLGQLLAKISEILGNLIKSDGFLGKK